MYKALNYFIVISIGFNSFLGFGQDTTVFEYEEDEKLNIELIGKVKAVTVEQENVQHKQRKTFMYNFDANGLPEKIVKFALGFDPMKSSLRDEGVHYEFKNGILISQLNKMAKGLDGVVYRYDDHWNLTLQKEYFNGILIQEIAQEFDTANRRLLTTEYLYGGYSDYNEKTEEGKEDYIYKKIEYKYDRNDHLITEIEHNFRKKLVRETGYKYDVRHNRIEEGYCTRKQGELHCKYKPLYGYDYDSENRLVKTFQLAQFLPHSTDTYYTYDKNGNEIEALGYYLYSDKEPELGYKYQYEYDAFGNMTKEVEVVGKYRSIGIDKYKIQLLNYDQFQNVTSQEYLDASGNFVNVVVYRYEYDSRQNWIFREKKEGADYENLEVTQVVTRTIDYY